MKDEIKEILDKLKDNDWYEELDLTGTKWIELKQEETNQLLDYITNLQKENMKLIGENEAIKSIKYTVDETIYKSRNEKAIEYVEKSKLNQLDTHCKYLYIDFATESIEHLDDLLNILQGSDDNE